jgi:acetylglutamate kinase
MVPTPTPTPAHDPLSAADKAKVLMEALPYIRRFAKKNIVVKYGGNAMTDLTLQKGFAEDVVLLKLVGINPIVVHGGGPQINRLLERLGKQGEFVQGMRVTDTETLSVVEMVLGGLVNQQVVSFINQAGGKAIGLTGKDGAFIRARKLKVQGPSRTSAPSEMLDIGLVGEVVSIDTAIIELLATQDFIPVIAPLGVDEEGTAYNINADVVAGKLAAALQAEKLVILTNTSGVYDKGGEVLRDLTAAQIAALAKDGTISAGMIPKIDFALDAVQNGVEAAHIIDGRVPHALLLEVLTSYGVGTVQEPYCGSPLKAESVALGGQKLLAKVVAATKTVDVALGHAIRACLGDGIQFLSKTFECFRLPWLETGPLSSSPLIKVVGDPIILSVSTWRIEAATWDAYLCISRDC